MVFYVFKSGVTTVWSHLMVKSHDLPFFDFSLFGMVNAV